MNTAAHTNHSRRPPRPLGERLTAHRRRILALVADGQTDRQIARQLGISRRTIGRHLIDIRGLLGAHDRAHAVVLAHRAGLLDLGCASEHGEAGEAR